MHRGTGTGAQKLGAPESRATRRPSLGEPRLRCTWRPSSTHPQGVLTFMMRTMAASICGLRSSSTFSRVSAFCSSFSRCGSRHGRAGEVRGEVRRGEALAWFGKAECVVWWRGEAVRVGRRGVAWGGGKSSRREPIKRRAWSSREEPRVTAGPTSTESAEQTQQRGRPQLQPADWWLAVGHAPACCCRPCPGCC